MAWKSHTITVFKGTEREFTGSRTQIAEHFRIRYNTLTRRLRNGYTYEQAIDWNGGKGAGARTFTAYKGTEKEYTGNLTRISEHFACDYDRLRISFRSGRAGISIEEAIEKATGKEKVVRGKRYSVFKGTEREFTGNDRQIAEHFGISLGTLRNRRRAGYTFEQAIDWNGGGLSDWQTVFQGTDKEFTGSITAIEERFGVYRGYLRDHMTHGLSIEEALLHKKYTGHNSAAKEE